MKRFMHTLLMLVYDRMPFEGTVALYGPGDGFFCHFVGIVAAAPPPQIGTALRRNGDLRAIGNGAGFGICVAAAGECAVLALDGVFRDRRGGGVEHGLIGHGVAQSLGKEGNDIRIEENFLFLLMQRGEQIKHAKLWQHVMSMG